jgi:hypothetical protein
MKVITAGDCIKIRIEAADEQSGIKEAKIVATNLRDLPGSPTFEAAATIDWPDNAESVDICLTIPEYIPDSKWKVASITLVNGAGRSILYSPSKDFRPILFNVKAKPGVDLTPAELKNVTLLDD